MSGSKPATRSKIQHICSWVDHDENNTVTNTLAGCLQACYEEPLCVGIEWGHADGSRANDCVLQKGECNPNANQNWDSYSVSHTLGLVPCLNMSNSTSSCPSGFGFSSVSATLVASSRQVRPAGSGTTSAPPSSTALSSVTLDFYRQRRVKVDWQPGDRCRRLKDGRVMTVVRPRDRRFSAEQRTRWCCSGKYG